MNADDMWHEDAHLSDEELVIAADGEAGARRAAKVRQHLESCWECRARMSRIESAIADLVQARSRELDRRLPPIAGPRALLRAQLAERASASQWTWRRRLGIAAAAFGVVLLGAYEWAAHPRMISDSEPGIAPKISLTPGATLPLTASEVCTAGFAQSIPTIPAAIKRKVFEVYGIKNARPDAYEVDYLITPELGGATSLRNLWPEPYHAPVWNAHVKDELEDRLHSMVCSGELDLATAQKDIATDWIAAYKKYLGRERPLVGRVRDLPEPPFLLARF